MQCFLEARLSAPSREILPFAQVCLDCAIAGLRKSERLRFPHPWQWVATLMRLVTLRERRVETAQRRENLPILPTGFLPGGRCACPSR